MAWFGDGRKTNIDSMDDCATCDRQRDCSYLSALEMIEDRRDERIEKCKMKPKKICKVCGAEYE